MHPSTPTDQNHPLVLVYLEIGRLSLIDDEPHQDVELLVEWERIPENREKTHLNLFTDIRLLRWRKLQQILLTCLSNRCCKRNNWKNEFPLKVKGTVHLKMKIKLLQHSPFSYWSRYWICFITEKYQEMAHLSPEAPKIPNWCENFIHTLFFLNETFM